ncbi:phospholipase D-like domain-containing protein [uncultured Tateyamaria sp.]|nr:phospholipase D-like domain-containing protein [uncultured Tateyamaria sp.]
MSQRPDFEVFVAADGAFAAFEEAVLDAQTSITGGFRIFDMSTPLLSDTARAVGETWFDLLVHVLRRGVRMDLAVSDFDPVYATELHQQAWATVKQGAALVETAGVPATQVRVRALLHPATPGMAPWLAFLPASLRKKRARHAALSRDALAEAPGLSRNLPDLHPVTHHQKLAVIDDDTLYIGGLDLNERRFDTPDHDRPAAQTWSDVQVIVRNDPAVAEAKAHIETFDDVVRGNTPPPPVQRLRRTLSADRRFKLPFLSPRTLVSEIETLHRDAFTQARHLIYIETQFMRSQPMAEALAEAAQARPDLTLILILPALPEPAAFDADDDIGFETRYGMGLERDALRTLRDGFGDRATIASPVQPVLAARETRATLAGSPIIYVHNKVLVQDADRAFVGSANMNGRSLHWDTEAGLLVDSPARVGTLRSALFHHWWRADIARDWTDPAQMQPLWQAEIWRNDVRNPDTRRGFLVSHDARLHEAKGQSLPLATDDMV